MSATATAPDRTGVDDDDVQPCANETVDRIATGVITALPILALGVVCWQVWSDFLGWSDIVVFAVMYAFTGFGITVGFHRHFTHRAFKARPWVRGLLAIAGSVAVEGPVISWVSDHRKHHAFSDQEGDPHSPHVGHAGGVRGALRGLFHAHLGWLFGHETRGRHERYAPDLLRDPVVAWVHRTFLLWVFAGLAVPFALGGLIGGSWHAALTGLVWGGFVRMLVLHHVTYSINSLCHFFGRKSFHSADESRNLAWLAPFSLGESWHNNHHAFPTSAAHGLRWYEVDLSALVIGAMERLGLVSDVVRVAPERMRSKALDAQ